MSRIDSDARDVLMKRRETLRRVPEIPPHVAESWRDWETAAEPGTDALRRELADIEAALQRIALGNYGVCEACGGPMGLQRIRAIPEARYCLSCSGDRLEAD